MFSRFVLSLSLMVAITGCTSNDNADTSSGEEATFDLDQEFLRIEALAESPSGHSVIVDCSDTEETWEDATATISVYQTLDRTDIDISVSNARPDTLFTGWLRLKGVDPDTGEEFGSSPITGAGSTALAPTTKIAELAAMMETEGSTEAANAFTTDANGNGNLSVELDFALIGGAYPFDRYDPSLEPVDIVGSPYAAFMIRLASHCTDGLAHGLVQGDRESWFNWYP